jgi:hypothetical protein
MKKWIVTADARRDITELRRRMVERGATVVDDDPVRLGADEQAVRAEGPDDLPDRLREDPMIHEVYPDSEIVLHGEAMAGSEPTGGVSGSLDAGFGLEPGFGVTPDLGTANPAPNESGAAGAQPGMTSSEAGGADQKGGQASRDSEPA